MVKLGLLETIILNALLILLLSSSMLILGAEEDNEVIRRAIESRTEDITDLSDLWNCISTQVIRDKFYWNRIHRIGRYESMPLTAPSLIKGRIQKVDITDPRKFYLGCVGIIKILESRRLIISGFEDESERNYSRKTFCISAAEYCFPVKRQLKVVNDYFSKVTENARREIIDKKEKDAKVSDLDSVKDDYDELFKDQFEKPKHHPLMEENIMKKKLLKNKIKFPELGNDVEIEFIDTNLEEIPEIKQRVPEGGNFIETGLEYDKLSRVSLYNVPINRKLISMGSWNFWLAILNQESRDNVEDNLRIVILSHNYPHELGNFSNDYGKLTNLCNKTILNLTKNGLAEIPHNVLVKAKESQKTAQARNENDKLLKEYLRWRDFEEAQPRESEDFTDYISEQLVIFEFCKDSIDIYLGNLQWSEIVNRQNSKLYGLPSGRPYKPFKYTFGSNIYEMRDNCVSCIWDLFINNLAKDLTIEGHTKTGKYDVKSTKKSIEYFCHFASISYFKNEEFDNEKSSVSTLENNSVHESESEVQERDLARKMEEDSSNLPSKFNPNQFDYNNFERDKETGEKHHYLANIEDGVDNEYRSTMKTSPTGYHNFKANDSLNKLYKNNMNGVSYKNIYGSQRNIDGILDEGVTVGLTVGETNNETQEYESLYKNMNIMSIVAFQQWKSLLYQMEIDIKRKRVPRVVDLPMEQPMEWNTPQYTGEKFYFVCVELLSSMLSKERIKIVLPHGGELDKYENKAKNTIKTFCREGTNRYFSEYERLFDIGSAINDKKPVLEGNNVNSVWSIIQEQVILDFINNVSNTVSEISPIVPKEFNPKIENLDFEEQCLAQIFIGLKSKPRRVIMKLDVNSESSRFYEDDEYMKQVIGDFCNRASNRYYSAIEYLNLYNESKNWVDPKYRYSYSITSRIKVNKNNDRSGTLEGIPFPPIKAPSSLNYKGKGRPDLYRNYCFSYLWSLWTSNRASHFYIEGTNYEKCSNLDMAKVVLEEFCTYSSVLLYKINPEILPLRDVLGMKTQELVGELYKGKDGNNSKNRHNYNDKYVYESNGHEYSGYEQIEYHDHDQEYNQDKSNTSESVEDYDDNDAKRQWNLLKQQLNRDINMNFIRFVKLPEYDQALYNLWPKKVPEEEYNKHCKQVINELLDLRLAILSSYLLDDREYTVESFCEESKFYVYSGMKEKIDDTKELSSITNDSISNRLHNHLMDTFIELSKEGYPLYRWLESILDLKSVNDMATLEKAIKWGESKGDWHYLDLIIKELDKETYSKIQKQVIGISPQGFVMSSGLFDKDSKTSLDATWGAIYLQSIKDAKSGNIRINGLVGDTPPKELWKGANNEQEFILSCSDVLRKLKVKPPFITFNTNGQSERGYIQLFCEDALDTLMEIQREPEKTLSLDFTYPGCINEAMRKWQWHQIYSQMEYDKKQGNERIVGIPPEISHKSFKGGKTPDEIEDQCENALDELDKYNQIKVLSKEASQYCHDSIENICSIDEDGKSNCNIERVRLEEIISKYHMDTPIGNPLKLDSRTRCMRIWYLLKNNLKNALKDKIIRTSDNMEFNNIGGDSFESGNLLGGFGGGSVFMGQIRFIVMKEIMDVCSPIDTVNNIIMVFMGAMKKIQQINSLIYSDPGVFNWVSELIIRYIADERTDNEYIELTGVNVFGDPYSDENNSADFLNKPLHSGGIPKKVRQLTDNEKAVMREKNSQKIDSIVRGIVKQTLPALTPLTSKEKKREITNNALLSLQKESMERDTFINSIGELKKYEYRPELPEKEKKTLALGEKIPLSIFSNNINMDIINGMNKGKPVKVFSRVDKRWEKVENINELLKNRDSIEAKKQRVKNMEINIKKLENEWLFIKNHRSYVITNIPEYRPVEYGDHGHKDIFNKDSMIRRCINFFANEKNKREYKINIKGNYVEKIANIRKHCTRSAVKLYDSKYNADYGRKEFTSRGVLINGKGKATVRSGRLIYVDGRKEPLQQVVTKHKTMSGKIIGSEISPEELEKSSELPSPGTFGESSIPQMKPEQIELVGSNNSYKALSQPEIKKKTN
ncbi:large with signal peptide [Cryptosporidium bovis]|uniref:large with signal peptide n=1 Tax=Cryptosporidium bovis TaxID=310047 RepID=UPI00351A76AA|nr:large with signal peptide [Cryptosporidium bovis]